MLEGDKFYKRKKIKDRGLKCRVTVGRGQVAIFNRLVQISGLTEKVRLVLDGHWGTLMR